MRKRMILMLVVMAGIIASLGAVKFRQIQTAIAQASSWAPPPEAVTTIVAREAQWEATLSAIGSVEAVQGVTVSADLPGIVVGIAFDSGARVRAGDVLVELDTSQERAQLQAAEAERDLAGLHLGRMSGLRGKGIIAQAEFDRATAESKQSQAGVSEIQAMIDRKTIRAPFAGILGIRQVNLGQYLTSGDPVVPLQSLDPIYVNFSVPQQEVAKLKHGAQVRAVAEGDEGTPPVGRITAINSIIDESTRNVQVQSTFANHGGRLRPGMFVEVQVSLGTSAAVVALPASAINYAPYGNSIFIVGDVEGPDGQKFRGVRQQFVKLGAARGDQIAVVSGVTAGDEVVTSGVFKLREGAAVYVNNEIQPANDPAPRPEDS
jgi:membrane fusion protein (multidrug efflux system)